MAILFDAYVVANTMVVGPLTPLPVPGLSRWVYLQDALDMLCGTLLIATGAAVLDRLLAREQAIQSATLAGTRRVTARAQRIAETADFHERVPEGPDATDRVAGATPPVPAVVELAATFNAMLARLEATFEAQRRLLADTSHELRNPLTVLRTNLAFLQREDADPQLRLDAAREAEEEAARMGRLVDDLLLLARDPSGELIARRPVRLDRLVQAVATEAREASTGHVVEVTACPATVVDGDAERLRQALRNVVGNALHHTPPGTHVRLCLERSARDVQLAVADDGPGIPADHVPHIFDRFYRVGVSPPRREGQPGTAGSAGAGLGLAIVKHLVEAHGGIVSIESAVGRGTTVSIRLPLVAA